ncbi:MAG: chromosome segregation protein SMC [Nanoarchaeota archaeon]|nr:chromosome segregation protein SMC [Nanoarchaeota archaeon]
MKGFKSFATKTEVLFGENFNCILGPNGSGKSNVLDSLCFVLGKAGAKGLRVEKSSNLIYNGGKTKKPAKEGEVSIWFDNSDGIFSSVQEKEVKITRIIKQTGQGVYKINDKTSTRTQIIDLLSLANINPDGYNIILQGDIVRLIEMSPNERRQIIEEIAGINIYEDKKVKAVRELNKVEDKLNEADIILAERETYLKELKKDRDKAQKYKDLEEKRKRNKKTLLVDNITQRQDQEKKFDADISSNEEKIKKIEEEIDALRKTIDERKKEIDNINHEVEEKGEKEQVKLHKIVEELKVQVAVNKQRLETIEGELVKLKDRQTELKNSHSELQGKTKDLERRKIETEKRIALREKDRETIEAKIEAFKKKNNLEAENSADTRVDEIDKEVESIQMDMNKLREEQQNLLREKDRVDLQLQSIDDKLEKLASINEEHKKELEALKQKKIEFKTATIELSKALSASADITSQLSTARSKSISKKEELARLEGRQASVLERLAAGSGLKAVLDLKKNDSSIFGTVAELGNVPKEYSTALEIAAGNKIKSVVVETDATAAKCIKHLKEKRLGVATFLPLNKIRAPTMDASLKDLKGPGIKGLAIDLITFHAKYRKVFEYVFGNTLVVEDVATARRIGIGKVRMVTLTGDIIEMSGAMQGGYRQQRAEGLFGQEEVAKQIAQLEGDLADTQTVISRLENQSYENEELITRLRSLKAELEGDIIKTEKSLHLDSDDANLDKESKKKLKEEAKELDRKIDDVQDQISEKNRDFAKLKIERQQLRDKISDLRNPAKLAELKSFEEKKMELAGEIIQLQGELRHTITEMETIIGPEGRKIFDILKQHEKEAENFREEKQKLQELVKTKETELKSLEKQEAAFYAQFKELFQKRSKLQDQVNKAEHTIVEKNSTQRNLEMKNNALGLERARIRAELSGFLEEDKEYQGIEPYTNKSKETIKRELAEFERLTLDLGAVNMRALEIYEEVEKEYHHLQEKKETLRKEREDVLVMMNEIDSKKKELFMRTFDALQENFKRIFSTLLMKGDASIVLENAQDPFEGGVEIKVRLTGKRFMDIRSLSGGEKTMTALAFLFAVQEYEPASFYVLDEVDAALDKKNSQKLAELIRGYCGHAQYVVISHNDGVISEADNLYGVSMNEHGMSKVTTLKI